MDSTINSLCVSSYNSTGFGIGAKNHISTLLTFSDILCLQEHFLLDSKSKKSSNTDKLVNEFGASHDMYVIPAVKANNAVSRGRGKGGLAMIWKKHLTKYVSNEPCDNYRIQAAKFKLPECEFLIINSYFPCNPLTENFDDSELINVLADIKYLIRKSGFHTALLAGDLNCHFTRDTHFTALVKENMNDLNLSILWEQSDYPVDYTHCSMMNDIFSFSTIDHFTVSPNLLKSVEEAGIFILLKTFQIIQPFISKLR